MRDDLYGSFARFFKYWSARLGTEEIDFYVRRATETGGPVVELGVGAGRVAIPIARRGIDVIGVDSSPAMLALASKDVADAGVQDRVRLVQADMRGYVAEPPVELVYIPNHSFQHMLTIDDQLACLEAARASLAPGGRLVVSAFVPDPFRIARSDGERQKVDDFTDELGRRCELWAEDHFEVVGQRLSLTAIFVAYEGDDVAERAETELDLHLFSMNEVRHLLARAGFEIDAVYGWFDERSLDESCREMIWIARKPS